MAKDEKGEDRVEALEKSFDKRFESIEKSILKVVDLVSKANQTPKEKDADVEKKSAEPNNAYLEPVHPEWLADAKAKIGESLDHCEVFYPKNGNPVYTIFIKKELSNASSSHMQFYKQDKRSIPVINGFESVKAWNTLVAQNLRLNPKKVE